MYLMKTVVTALVACLSFAVNASNLSPNSSDCAEIKSHFNSVGYAEKQRLLNSCVDVYYAGSGWFNSATGCGKCPSSPNTPLCENSPSACAQVAALGAAQQAILEIGKGITKNLYKQAVKKIQTFSFELVADDERTDVEAFSDTSRVTPVAGSLRSAELNEVIAADVAGFYSECVVPLFKFEQKKAGGWLHSLVENAPLCKLEKGGKVFHGLYFNVVKQRTGEPAAAYSYSLKEKKKGIDICQRAMGFNVACSKKHSPDDFIFSRGFVAQQDQPRAELIYRGGDAERVFLELISSGTTQKFVHEMSLGDLFSCGGFEMSINFTDGDVLTFSRNTGSPSDFTTGC